MKTKLLHGFGSVRHMSRYVFGLALLALGFSSPAKAIEAVYLGGEVGYVGLQKSWAVGVNDALGFGFDVGFRTNARVDLTMSLLTSSHSGSGDLKLLAPFASADFHVAQAYDFDFTLGAGPGFYNFSNSGVSETKFGMNLGGAVDVILDDHLRVGMGARYHVPFGSSVSSGNFYTVTMRVGYLFTME